MISTSAMSTTKWFLSLYISTPILLLQHSVSGNQARQSECVEVPFGAFVTVGISTCLDAPSNMWDSLKLWFYLNFNSVELLR